MFTVELNQELEARLFEIARQEDQTPEQIVARLLDHYINRKNCSNLLVDIAKDLPVIEAFTEKDPLSIQQEMRDEWR